MEKTCFVIIGFGTKTDFATGRKINLDATFENIIKPVFDDLGILCFRSCDIKQTGVIDRLMYEHILKADFVVADISTLNPNAIYELGIRHALKPNTTIVMAEDQLQIPFDVNHIFVHAYHHLEEDIGVSEARRFQKELRELVERFSDTPEVDSPVYTFLPNLNPPKFTEEEIDKLKDNIEEFHSTADLVDLAEKMKDNKEYESALQLLKKANAMTPNDSYILQRMALITYKSNEPTPVKALQKALKILEVLEPNSTTDPETLGLLGAIYKRLYENNSDSKDLEASLHYYERGYYVKQDYYNGINVAFLYAKKASEATDISTFWASRGQAEKIWKHILDRWGAKAKEDDFSERGDRGWIYLTLAEAAYGLKKDDLVEYYVNLAKEIPVPDFAISTYKDQQSELQKFPRNYQE